MSSVREQVLTWKETVQLRQPPKQSSSFGVLGFCSIQSIHVGFHSKKNGWFPFKTIPAILLKRR